MFDTQAFNTFYSNFQLLPEQDKSLVADYVQFLLMKWYFRTDNKTKTTDTEKKTDVLSGDFWSSANTYLVKKEKPVLGSMKGLVRYMSPDFNDPIEDFIDYM